MKTKVVVNVFMNGCQSRPTMKKCISGCLKSMVPCLFQEATCKNKVMKIAATLPGKNIIGFLSIILEGVEKVSIEEEKKLLTVIGEGIDAVKLVNILGKKVGFATIVTVGPEEEKKEEKKKEKKPADNKEEPPQQPWVYYNRVLPMGEIYEIRDPCYYNSSCFPFW